MPEGPSVLFPKCLLFVIGYAAGASEKHPHCNRWADPAAAGVPADYAAGASEKHPHCNRWADPAAAGVPADYAAGASEKHPHCNRWADPAAAGVPADYAAGASEKHPHCNRWADPAHSRPNAAPAPRNTVGLTDLTPLGTPCIAVLGFARAPVTGLWRIRGGRACADLPAIQAQPRHYGRGSAGGEPSRAGALPDWGVPAFSALRRQLP